jgi:hypothetical protein
MTERTVNLIKNLPPVLQGFSLEELYQLTRCLSNELIRRGLDAGVEARGLELALLVPARQEHHARTAEGLEHEAAGIVNVLQEFSSRDHF